LLSSSCQTFRDYLRDKVLPAVRDKHGEYLLVELVKQWEHHKIMNKWMFRFFMYLVRARVPVRRPSSRCTLTAPAKRAQNRYYREHHSLPTLEEAGARRW
jgi:cullin 1